ncbi:MAG: hypothetical protein ACK55I_13930, partial [bacterium]
MYPRYGVNLPLPPAPAGRLLVAWSFLPPIAGYAASAGAIAGQHNATGSIVHNHRHDIGEVVTGCSNHTPPFW